MTLLNSLYKQEVVIRLPLWLTMLSFLAIYGLWELYWYSQVGLSFVKWHTHLIFYVIIWLTGMSLIRLIPSRFNVEGFAISYTSVTLTLLLIEVALMICGINKTYTENRNGTYMSIYNFKSEDSLRRLKPYSEHHLVSPEFDYTRQTNNYGFSDYDFANKADNILFQIYGDSFTEGDGAPFDSSYPAILRTILQRENSRITIQNYGQCGNDPGFYVTQFGNLGKVFNPDILIMCYGTGDLLVDFYSRGGLERFDKNGWHTRKGPWWEYIYAMSYVSRLFFHAAGYEYNNFFATKTERTKILKSLEPKWNEVFGKISELAKANNCKILLFKKPERSEIILKQYQYNMDFFENYIKDDSIFRVVDLMPYYNAKGLTSEVNTTPYYWPQDGHHNSKGYRVLAEIIYMVMSDNFPEYTKP